MAKNNDCQPATKGDLAAVKTELKSDIANLSGEILKVNFRMDRIEDTINTKVAMKDDLNRIFNLLDSISGDVKRYQREDTLRGEAIMQYGEKLSNHENRITLLETKK